MKLPVMDLCKQLMKKNATSFYESFATLPSPRREAVYVIYGFCRLIDDSVDEPDKSPYSIYELKAHLTKLEDAQGHFIWPALRWLFDKFPYLTKRPFFDLIKGQLMDLTLTKYTTRDQLETYCYLVAGTVGEMLLPVLRDDDGATVVTSGVWLGKGMQMVNIIRDIGEDKSRNRRYIPLELMQKYDYTERDWEAGVVNEAFICLLQELQSIAHDWMEQGMAHLHLYSQESAFCIQLAATLYAEILNFVEKNEFDVYSKRAYVPQKRRLELLHVIMKKYPSIPAHIIFKNGLDDR